MGINIHAGHYLGYGGTAYNDWNAIIDVVGDLGFRNVRDHGIEVAKLNALTDATGAKLMAITEWQDNTSGVLKLNMSKLNERMQQTRQLTGLGWIEGPNEYDAYPDPNWKQTLLAWQSQMYTYAKADAVLKHIPVVAPSLYGSPDMNVLAPYTDYANMHQYPAGEIPLTHHYWAAIRAGWVAGADKQVMATESGYDNGFEDVRGNYGVTELASYKYVPRLFMDYYQWGHPNFFLYELADDQIDTEGPTGHGFREFHWGLLRHDLTYKPSAYAVKNLISQLSDVGDEFTPGELDYTITGGNENLRQVLLQKRDGSYVLALWQDVDVYNNEARADITNAALPITLNLNIPIASAETYLLDSMIPTTIFAGLSQYNFDVLDEVMLLHLTPGAAVGHEWTKPGDGAWATAGNWSGGAPAGAFTSANFGAAGPGAHVVSVNAPVSVGAIKFDSAASYTVGGSGTITIDTPVFGAIRADAGNHTIAAPLLLARDTTITVDSDAALHINNLLDSPNALVTKAGAGAVDVNRVRAKKIKVSEGTLRMQDGGGTNVVNGVAVSAGAKLDLQNNSLIVRGGEIGTFENGAYTGMLGLIATGRGEDGTWRGTGGIVTSMNDATTGVLATLAVATAEEANYAGGTFGGVSVAGDDVLIMYTWGGDADLNGELNGDDYFRIDSNILLNGVVFGFHNGDFNYDGQLNGDDYFILDGNYVYAQASGGLRPVPEPCGALIGAGGALLLVRRRPYIRRA